MKKETIEDLKKRLTSRKLWMSLGGVAGYILLAVVGEIEWISAMDGVKSIVMLYVAAEGGTDIARHIKK